MLSASVFPSGGLVTAVVSHRMAGSAPTDYGAQEFVFVGTNPDHDADSMATNARVVSISSLGEVRGGKPDFKWCPAGVVQSAGPGQSRQNYASTKAVTIAVQGQLSMVNYWAGLNTLPGWFLWFVCLGNNDYYEPATTQTGFAPSNARRAVRVGRVALSSSTTASTEHANKAMQLTAGVVASHLARLMACVGLILVHVEVEEINRSRGIKRPTPSTSGAGTTASPSATASATGTGSPSPRSPTPGSAPKKARVGSAVITEHRAEFDDSVGVSTEPNGNRAGTEDVDGIDLEAETNVDDEGDDSFAPTEDMIADHPSLYERTRPIVRTSLSGVALNLGGESVLPTSSALASCNLYLRGMDPKDLCSWVASNEGHVYQGAGKSDVYSLCINCAYGGWMTSGRNEENDIRAQVYNTGVRYCETHPDDNVFSEHFQRAASVAGRCNSKLLLQMLGKMDEAIAARSGSAD